MDPAKLTRDVQLTLAQAHQKALDLGHGKVRPEHVLLALLAHEDVAFALADYLVDVAGLKDVLLRLLLVGNQPATGDGLLGLSPELDAILADTWQKVRAAQRRQIQLSDLIMALLDEGSRLSLTSKLPSKGLKVRDLERGLIEHAPGRPKAPEGAYRNLRSYSRCLTDAARASLLDPVIGRHGEIRRVMQVLCRREKNNPLLIGPVGIGKTSIVLALAQLVAENDVPEALKGADIFALDIASLTSGAEFRGMLEERLKGIIADVRQSRGKGIIFIEDIASAVRRGTNATDISGLLRPALASGDLRVIGVTSTEDYRQYIEKDAALERCFQPIRVAEPTIEETVSVLRGVKSRYEAHHDLHITDAALQAAATLSHRFIQDRSLPDKAIDLLDEAASKVRIEWDSLPLDVNTGRRRIAELQTEIESLPAGYSREGIRFQEEIARLQTLLKMTAEERKAQASLAHRIVAERRDLAWEEMVASFADELEWTRDFRKRASDSIARLRHALEQDEADLATRQEKRRLFKVDIDDEDVAEVVAGWTGIPLSKLMEDERAKLLDMENALHQRVVGQEDAIVAVSNAVRLARAGMKDPNRPVGSFLFLGPTGVGKTELCRALAEFLFDDEAAMIRIDMSEYMDKHTVSRLVGAPPGYIGYDDSGQLTEAIRRRPYSVVLFDEIEKAHPDVFNILLQIMEDGRLTDGHGRTVDFKNAIVTMTSNVGGHLYRDEIEGKTTETRRREEDDDHLSRAKSESPRAGDLHEHLMDELREAFRPEFLNRLDAIVFFELLSREQIKQIVEIQVRLVNRRLAGGDITLEVEEGAKAYLADEGYDVLQGARPLKRLIQQKVLEPLAVSVLRGELKAGDTVMIGLQPGNARELKLTRVPRQAATPAAGNGRQAAATAGPPAP